MDLSDLRERVERARPSEGVEQSAMQSAPLPHRWLDADDLTQMKTRAYYEGRSDGYREGVDHGRTWERDLALNKVREAETRGVMWGLTAAMEAVDIANGEPREADRDPLVQVADQIGSMYEALSREGLHGERKLTNGSPGRHTFKTHSVTDFPSSPWNAPAE